MGKTIRMRARAKINLTLDVVGKRENGYHDVEMIMQQIDLHDWVTVTCNDSGVITLSSNDAFLPLDERNLAYKAALEIKKIYGLSDGFHIDIEKRIPVAAGLAGGSTDAAATLMAINKLCQLHLSKEKLCGIGLKLGADIPFCIMGNCQLARGLGEELTPIRGFEHAWMILIKPHFGVSTKDVYTALKWDEISNHPDTQGMIEALLHQDRYGVYQRLSNVLEAVTLKLNPEVQDIKDYLLHHGAQAVLMSGSGPTVFGFYKDFQRAKNAHKKIKMHYPQSFVTSTYNGLTKEGL